MPVAARVNMYHAHNGCVCVPPLPRDEGVWRVFISCGGWLDKERNETFTMKSMCIGKPGKINSLVYSKLKGLSHRQMCKCPFDN